jgi:hypothetical protein
MSARTRYSRSRRSRDRPSISDRPSPSTARGWRTDTREPVNGAAEAVTRRPGPRVRTWCRRVPAAGDAQVLPDVPAAETQRIGQPRAPVRRSGGDHAHPAASATSGGRAPPPPPPPPARACLESGLGLRRLDPVRRQARQLAVPAAASPVDTVSDELSVEEVGRHLPGDPDRGAEWYDE